MEDFIRENPITSCLLALFALEQVAYLFLGSYPYRFGVRLRTEELPNASSINNLKNQRAICGIKLKTSKIREEAYLKPMYFALTWGPTFFTCQIISTKEGKAITRMGPAAALLVGSMFIESVISIDAWGLLNALCLLAFIGWLYTTFRRNCLALFKQIA